MWIAKDQTCELLILKVVFYSASKLCPNSKNNFRIKYYHHLVSLSDFPRKLMDIKEEGGEEGGPRYIMR